MVYQNTSALIMACNWLRNSAMTYTERSISIYSFLLPTTNKQIDFASVQATHASTASASAATICQTAGEHGTQLQNFLIILQPPILINSAYIEDSVAQIHIRYTITITTNSFLQLQKNGAIEEL